MDTSSDTLVGGAHLNSFFSTAIIVMPGEQYHFLYLRNLPSEPLKGGKNAFNSFVNNHPGEIEQWAVKDPDDPWLIDHLNNAWEQERLERAIRTCLHFASHPDDQMMEQHFLFSEASQACLEKWQREVIWRLLASPLHYDRHGKLDAIAQSTVDRLGFVKEIIQNQSVVDYVLQRWEETEKACGPLNPILRKMVTVTGGFAAMGQTVKKQDVVPYDDWQAKLDITRAVIFTSHEAQHFLDQWYGGILKEIPDWVLAGEIK